MNQDLLKKIIFYGIQAPSGDNSQPWKFIINKNNEINLINLPEKDNPILNIHQGGSLISHGAVILNIKIASYNFGFKAIVNYFPDSTNKNLIANISFVRNNEIRPSFLIDLFDSIIKRSTNRHFYEKKLAVDLINEIENLPELYNCKVKFFKEQKDIDKISESICLSEEIILQTRELHELLFRDILWNQKQELKIRHGLFVKTLEFNPIQLFVFWLCRKWNIIQFLNNKFKFAKFVSKQNSNIYKSSGILGFIIIPNTDNITYVKAGELFQSIWLKTTKLGLGFQPVTGLFFLNERVKTLGNDPISKEQSLNIVNNYKLLKDMLDINGDDTILTSFRIGKSKDSSARSSRLHPNIVIE